MVSSSFFVLFDSEIGAHVLSGNVFDPKGLYELFPEKQSTWTDELREATGSVATPVTNDQFHVLPNATSSQLSSSTHVSTLAN